MMVDAGVVYSGHATDKAATADLDSTEKMLPASNR